MQGKDKTQSVAPVLLEDASVDQEGKPLPRVFVPPTKTPGNFAAGRHGALDQVRVESQGKEKSRKWWGARGANTQVLVSLGFVRS